MPMESRTKAEACTQQDQEHEDHRPGCRPSTDFVVAPMWDFDSVEV
jgi:hypothetical protein